MGPVIPQIRIIDNAIIKTVKLPAALVILFAAILNTLLVFILFRLDKLLTRF